MKTRRFGRTEIEMPVFSVGGMRYQHKWQDIPLSDVPKECQDNLENIVHRALELGLNHLETARGYGSSEIQLGRVLQEIPRESYILQTKVVPSSPQEFLETFELSLKTLGLEYVDLLSVHGINLPEHLECTLKPGGPIDILHQMQKDGRIRHMGFSTHGNTSLILEAIRTGAFDYLNLHYYYINQFNWPAIEAASKQDMGVFIISPTDKGGMLYKPSPILSQLCQPLHPIEFNDLFCLSHPEIHTLSLGAAKPSDFDLHVQSLEYYENIETIMNPIKERLDQRQRDTLGSGWFDNWHKDLPQWFENPGHYNIIELLRLYNLVKSFDMIDFGKYRYNLMGYADHWMPGASLENLNQDQIKKAISSSCFRDQIPEMIDFLRTHLHEKPAKRLSESS